MAKRDPERWGENSNIRLETQYGAWGKKWKEDKRRDEKSVVLLSTFILCKKHGVNCLKVTPKMLKKLMAMHALGIKEITLSKQNSLPRAMLKGIPRGSYTLSNTRWFTAEYKGKGVWKFNIVG